jgi:glycosyltransferase involved in cell wall biosynthesis
LPAEDLRKGLRIYRPNFLLLPRLPQLRPRFLAQRLLPLLAEIRARFPFEIISAEFSWPEGPAAVAVGEALGIPVSIKARGMDFEHRGANAATRRQLIDSGCKAAGLLAVSRPMKDKMTELGLPEDRIGIHYPAVDGTLFRPRDREAAKAALGVTGPLLLNVGNLIPIKQQRLAVEALLHLDAATLILVGNGPDKARLRGLIATLGLEDRVRMMGSIAHGLLPALFAAADVLIHCPSIEGFANVRLEALACGTPIVTTAVGEADRLVRRPEAGIIVDPDPRSIADAVRRILAEPPQAEAVRAMVDEFTWDHATDQFEAHLRRVAGSAANSRLGSY